jgi:hypothetical protein
MRKNKVGEILLERGLISADALSKALKEQQSKFVLSSEVLPDRKFVSRNDLVPWLEEMPNVIVPKACYIDSLHRFAEGTLLNLRSSGGRSAFASR